AVFPGKIETPRSLMEFKRGVVPFGLIADDPRLAFGKGRKVDLRRRQHEARGRRASPAVVIGRARRSLHRCSRCGSYGPGNVPAAISGEQRQVEFSPFNELFSEALVADAR